MGSTSDVCHGRQQPHVTPSANSLLRYSVVQAVNRGRPTHREPANTWPKRQHQYTNIPAPSSGEPLVTVRFCDVAASVHLAVASRAVKVHEPARHDCGPDLRDTNTAATKQRMFAQAQTSLPVMVYFHGGCWFLNSMDTHDGLMRRFANAGSLLVIGVEYRWAADDLHGGMHDLRHCAPFQTLT